MDPGLTAGAAYQVICGAGSIEGNWGHSRAPSQDMLFGAYRRAMAGRGPRARLEWARGPTSVMVWKWRRAASLSTEAVRSK